MAQAGGSFLSEDGSTVNFNTPEGIKAAAWLVNKVGNTMPAAGDASTDSDADLFSTGHLAMWHTGIWMFNAMQEVPFGWDIVVEPGLTDQASHLFSNAVMVSAQHQEHRGGDQVGGVPHQLAGHDRCSPRELVGVAACCGRRRARRVPHEGSP